MQLLELFLNEEQQGEMDNLCLEMRRSCISEDEKNTRGIYLIHLSYIRNSIEQGFQLSQCEMKGLMDVKSISVHFKNNIGIVPVLQWVHRLSQIWRGLLLQNSAKFVRDLSSTPQLKTGGENTNTTHFRICAIPYHRHVLSDLKSLFDLLP
ncbi:hypothetical protein AVEN_30373-1 [Araneus ventricosus]|uniref:Uncharacterized protein n=1 Tax=Araneus ventricosus TaxID=182803 RepID=A0A4Y2UUW1_ARAVE|nr:hypothetical protein AVEN_30373-1 [Araneus ventricosus]